MLAIEDKNLYQSFKDASGIKKILESIVRMCR